MSNTVNIFNISGNIFQEINYNHINELREKLLILISNYDDDIYIQLLINNDILNNFNIIDDAILLKITEYNFITVIFSNKKELYCLKNKNGKYILDYKNKNDNYSKLLKLVISDNKNNSYNIIKNNSYKELLLLNRNNCLISRRNYIEFASNTLKMIKNLY